MQMNRQWMYADRRSAEFMKGVRYFLDVAEANKRNGFMSCPCGLCRNQKEYSSSKTLHIHLIQSGFMSGYNCWTKHGERGVMMEDNEEEENDDNYPMFPEYGGNARGEAEDEDEEAQDEPVLDDDLRRAIVDAQREAESANEKLKLERMLEDHKKKIVPYLQRWEHKARYHTGIAAMEGRDWFI
jgi:Transposase-associated domain